jgi:hypothetical protein
MYKILHVISGLFLAIILSGCAHLGQSTNSSNGKAQWDFDHQVQYRQTQLADNYYQLEVIPNNNVSFDRLASFLIRKSYSLCGSYKYKLEMIKGIEGYNDKLARPHYIFSSLTANVEC